MKSDGNDPKPGPDRRDLLLGGAGTGLAIFAPRAASAAETKTLGLSLEKTPDLKKVGGTVRLKLAGKFVVLVRESEKKVAALDATCTHKKCKVKFKEKTGRLHCKCHKSAFTLDGEVLGGPAKKPLPTYRTKLDGDRLLIKIPVED